MMDAGFPELMGAFLIVAGLALAVYAGARLVDYFWGRP